MRDGYKQNTAGKYEVWQGGKMVARVSTEDAAMRALAEYRANAVADSVQTQQKLADF